MTYIIVTHIFRAVNSFFSQFHYFFIVVIFHYLYALIYNSYLLSVNLLWLKLRVSHSCWRIKYLAPKLYLAKLFLVLCAADFLQIVQDAGSLDAEKRFIIYLACSSGMAIPYQFYYKTEEHRLLLAYRTKIDLIF